MFLGESLLSKSKYEVNKREKQNLIEKGIMHIQQDPARINLEIAIPPLVENGNFKAILDICIKKADALDKDRDANEIIHVY